MAPGPEIPCYMPRHHPRPRNIVRSLLRQTHTADVPVSLQDLPAYRAPHEIWMKGKSSDIISSELNVPLNFKYMRWQASLYSTWDCRRSASSSNSTRILTSPRSSWKMPSMQLLGCYPLAITIFPMTSLAFVATACAATAPEDNVLRKQGAENNHFCRTQRPSSFGSFSANSVSRIRHGYRWRITGIWNRDNRPETLRHQRNGVVIGRTMERPSAGFVLRISGFPADMNHVFMAGSAFNTLGISFSKLTGWPSGVIRVIS